MRFLVRAQIPTEIGNKIVKNPKFLQELENYIHKVKQKHHISLNQVGIELLSLSLTLKMLK
jgi:hypothetical protein